MASVLIIDEKAKEAARLLKSYALTHRLSHRCLEKMVKGEVQPIGDDPNFSVVFPINHRIVLSVEEQPIPKLNTRWCMHLSCSLIDSSLWPHPDSICSILDMLGMERPIPGRSIIYQEKEVKAINIIVPLEETESPQPFLLLG